jgi:nucleoside 2-deoxyribosyltransferase
VVEMREVKVYIAGPILGIEDNQDYRKELTQILVSQGHVVKDPWQREKILSFPANQFEWWKKVSPDNFIEKDLEDIDNCDILIAYLPFLSAGTCMELFYAKRNGKRTWLISGLDEISPWIIYHTDLFFKTVKEFENYLKKQS